MNDTSSGLDMLRFMREGISCEAIFKSKARAEMAYAAAQEDVSNPVVGWHTVTDDFGVSHTLDLSRFLMVFFAFADIAQRDLAMKSVQQGSKMVGAQGQGFIPRQ